MAFAQQRQILEPHVQSLLRDFSTGWDEDRLPEYAGQLPKDAPWRPAMLRELVKIDLRRQWEHGHRALLDSYLLHWPELGTLDTVPLELIQAEMQARQQVGDVVSSEELNRRFPRQMREAQRSVNQVFNEPVLSAELASLFPSAPGSSPSFPPASVRSTPPQRASLGPGASPTGTVRPIESEADIDLQGEMGRRGSDPGRYRLVKELGRGAMGSVYLAQDTSLQRLVAMKIPHFRPGDSPDLLKRFYIEACAAATLSHPNICAVYDVGKGVDGIPWLTMAYIEGETLTDLIKRERPLPPVRAVEIIYKLARALEEAHSRSIVHRDLKPANVMMNRRGEPVVMDFGLARRMDQDTRLTHQGSVMGTPAYMPPEQVRGDVETIGPASDQYSLAVILYEMLTGQVPFRGTLGQVMASVLTEKPRPPRELRPDLDPALEAVCLKAMASTVAERFPLIGAFAQALEPFIQSLSILQHPSSVPGIGQPREGEDAFHTAAPGTAPPVYRPRSNPEVKLEASTLSPPGWKKSTVPPPGWKPRVRLKTVLLAALLAAGALTPLYFILTPETDETFRRHITGYIDQGKFRKALTRVEDSRHDKKINDAALEEVRRAVVDWADSLVKDTTDRGKEAEVRRAQEVLNRLLPHCFDEKKQKLVELRDGAGRLAIRWEVDDLLERQRHKDAWDAVAGSGFTKTPWAGALEAKILKAWVGHAERLRTKDNDFDQAVQVAKAILDVRKDTPDAARVRDDAGKQIKTITEEIANLVEEKQFSQAEERARKKWPLNKDLRDKKIFEGWYAWAKKQREAKKLNEAEKELDDLDKYYQDGEHRTRTAALREDIAFVRISPEVERASKGTTWDGYEAAAQLLAGKDAARLNAEARKGLYQRLTEAFRKRLQGQVTEEVLPQLKQVAALLKNPDAVSDVKTWEEKFNVRRKNKTSSAQVAAALQLKEVTSDSLATVRQTLQELSTNAQPDLRQRIETLLPLLAFAAKGAEAPQGKALDAFEDALKSKGIDADRKALKQILGRLFDLRVRRSVPTLAEEKAWEERLKDCRKVTDGPSAWVLACRVECLAELKQAKREVPEEEWQRAWEELQKEPPAPEAAAYAAYARALGGLATSAVTAQAADQMREMFGRPTLPPELKSARRKQRTAEVLVAAAKDLRDNNGTFTEPFGPAGGADKAFAWLEVAYGLAGPSVENQLRRDLAEAAWYKSAPDPKRAGELVASLVQPEALKSLKLDTPETFRLALIHARTRDESLAGRKAAVGSYLIALEKLRSLLHRKGGAGKGFENNVVRPVCKAFYAYPLTALLTNKGREELFTKGPDAELKSQVARLCAETAGLIKTESLLWEDLAPLKCNPVEKAVDLYDAAYELAPKDNLLVKAEYLVNKAYAYYTLPHPLPEKLREYAKKATKLAPEYAGGYGLRGITLITEARNKSDYQEKLKLLLEANTQLQEAVKRGDKLEGEKARDLSLLVYGGLGAAGLELGNYVADKVQKAKYLRQGRDYMDRLVKLDPGNLEGWHTYAALLEDIGFFVEEPETNYGAACDALKKAMNRQHLVWEGGTKPWLARGRIRVKWAELIAPDPKRAAKVTELLEGATEDLGEILQQRVNDPVQGAEAFSWRGKIHLLRKDITQAGQAFAQGLALARKAAPDRKAAAEVWEESLLTDWGYAALGEASTRLARGNSRGSRTYVKVAEDRAPELKKFSHANAAWIFFNTRRLKSWLDEQAEDGKKLLEILDAGLEPGRSQDRPTQLLLHCERAKLYFDGGVFKQQDPVKARRYALEALKFAADTPGASADARAVAAGIVGQACFYFESPKDYFPEAIEKLREAVSLSPTNAEAWKWRTFLGAALYKQLFEQGLPKGTLARARILEEAARRIAEAEQAVPASTSKAFKDFVRNWRKDIEKEARPALEKALADAAARKGPDAWKWHWRLAEILNRSDDTRAEARNQIRQADEALPPTVSKEDRDRVKALRKQLQNRT